MSKRRIQGWLLNEAGLALLNIGRPKEAEELFVKKTNMQIEDENEIEAITGYQNLAELYFRTGELKRALSNAEKAHDAAKKKAMINKIIIIKSIIGWILYLMGKSREADNEFRQAAELDTKIYSDHGLLYGLAGAQIADFFISMKRIDGAFKVTSANLETCKTENMLYNISICHRCLGAIERIKGNHKEARAHLQKALELAHKVGMPALEIETLLEFGRLHLDRGRYEDAVNACRAVLKLCERSGFKLYEPDAEVVQGKAYLASGDIKQAKTFARSAYEKAAGMHYRWQEGDAAHLLGETYLKEGDIVEARKWIEKAVACRKEILDPEVKESERVLESL